MVVRPNDELAALMNMEQNTKYKKMEHRGGGGSGIIDPGKEASFHIEYQIKSDVDLEKVKKYALYSTLVVVDGNKIIAEIPLKNF